MSVRASKACLPGFAFLTLVLGALHCSSASSLLEAEDGGHTALDAGSEGADAGWGDSSATTDVTPPTLEAGADAGLPGDTCENPTPVDVPIGESVELRDQTTIGFSNSYSGRRTCMRGDGRDHVYAVTVPAKTQLNTKLQSAPGFNQLVEIVVGSPSRCDEISVPQANPGAPCAIAADYGLVGGVDLASYYNDSDAADEAFVIVDAALDSGPGQSGGNYRLTLSIESPPPGDTCETAVHITEGLLLNQSTVGYGNNYGNDTLAKKVATGCAPSAGPERVYSIDVPAQTKLIVTATPSASFDTSVNIVVGSPARCNVSPRTCDASNDIGNQREPDTASYVNASSLTATAFIIIDTYLQDLTGPFTLETRLEATP